MQGSVKTGKQLSERWRVVGKTKEQSWRTIYVWFAVRYVRELNFVLPCLEIVIILLTQDLCLESYKVFIL